MHSAQKCPAHPTCHPHSHTLTTQKSACSLPTPHKCNIACTVTHHHPHPHPAGLPGSSSGDTEGCKPWTASPTSLSQRDRASAVTLRASRGMRAPVWPRRGPGRRGECAFGLCLHAYRKGLFLPPGAARPLLGHIYRPPSSSWGGNEALGCHLLTRKSQSPRPAETAQGDLLLVLRQAGEVRGTRFFQEACR